MKRRVAVLRTFAAVTLVIALEGVGAAAASNPGGVSAEHATLNVDSSSVAGSVIGALVSGTDPSTVVANRGGHGANARSNSHNDNEGTETEAVNNLISPSTQVADAGTTGAKPGFGCGDKNHTHSGPPGRPGASLPPGCAKQQ